MAVTNLNLTPAPRPATGTNTVSKELRDIKPPVEIPNGWALVWWSLGILLVAILTFLAWRAWQTKRRQVPAVPIIPAHIRARKQLEAAIALLNQPREFCILVSDTIRQYLEERFDFHAPERTTEEFLYELQSTNLLLPDQKESLGEFLKSCDLVKFARYEPRVPELRELHASAVRLVDETEPAAPVAPGANVPVSPAQSEPVAVSPSDHAS